MFGLSAVRPSCSRGLLTERTVLPSSLGASQWNAPAGLARTGVGSLRSGWIGFGVLGQSGQTAEPVSGTYRFGPGRPLGRAQMILRSSNGIERRPRALHLGASFDWNESRSRPVRGSRGGWRCRGTCRSIPSESKSRRRNTSTPARGTGAPSADGRWRQLGLRSGAGSREGAGYGSGCPSAVAPGSRSLDGPERNGPCYSGTSGEERLDGRA